MCINADKELWFHNLYENFTTIEVILVVHEQTTIWKQDG